MISDMAEALMESLAQARPSPASEEGSTARGGGASPTLAAMGGGREFPQQPGEMGPSSGARGTVVQPSLVEGAPTSVPPAGQRVDRRSTVPVVEARGTAPGPAFATAAAAVPPGGSGGDRRSPVERQSPEDSETPSPGRRTISAEEAVEELRRLRDEIRDLQMMQPQAVVAPPRGGEQYKVPVPDKYSPRGQKSPSEFLFQCEQFFEASGVPLERQVPFASTLLADAASAWWRQHRTSWPGLRAEDRIVTWEQFKEALRLAFTPLTEGKVAKDRLYSLRQTGSVQAYTAIFRQLTFEIDNLAESEKFTLYERGLKSIIKTHLALARVTTLEDAMAVAESVDVALHQPDVHVEKPAMRAGGRVGGRGFGRRLGALGGPVADPGPPTPDLGFKDDSLADLLELAALVRRGNRRTNPGGEPAAPTNWEASPGTRGRDLTRVRCYHCQQLGHIQWECPLKGRSK